MGRRCAIQGCNSKLSLFRIPFKPNVREEWVKFIEKSNEDAFDFTWGYLCEIHFSPRDVIKMAKRIALKSDAVPHSVGDLGKSSGQKLHTFIPQSILPFTATRSKHVEFIDEESNHDESNDSFCSSNSSLNKLVIDER